MRAALIYPHQLFPEHPALSGADVCVLVEEPLLLTQYRFHRQKLILHRASMQHFADRLRRQKRQVRYVECGELDSTGDIANVLTQLGVQHAQFVDPCDTWLQQRLMILGNFMLLCEIDPAAIHQWFMELFIDAYDWVMVPNVYGMSQHADGGLITTKPYLSGSSYVLKMSNFRKGPWCPIWDALYWRFIDRHREFFAGNPRMSVMVAQCDRMGSRLDEHLRTAEQFLTRLHGDS